MDDQDEVNTENGLDGERSIPAVGKANTGNRDKYFMPAFLTFLVISAVIVWVYSASQDGAASQMTDKTEEDYDRESVVSFEIPDTPPKPAQIAQPTSVTVSSQPVQTLSAEEQRRLQAEADLRERRKRSPVVIYDQLKGKTDSKTGVGATSTEERKEALLASLGERLTGQSGVSNSLLGGEPDTSKDALGDRLLITDAPGVSAKLINDEQLPFIIAEGKVISAVLETAIQSDLPGKVRAVVTEDIYSFNCDLKLLEKGSRLVGEYQSGIRQGQTRVFVTWSRVITPFGVDVALESPGTGPLGRAGVGGWVDSHFLERFGSSILLSVVGAYTAREAASDSPQAAQVQRDVGDSFNRSAEIALENSINIPPTVNVNQGAYIKVFVARDLNFKDAYLLNEQQKKRKGYAAGRG